MLLGGSIFVNLGRFPVYTEGIFFFSVKGVIAQMILQTSTLISGKMSTVCFVKQAAAPNCCALISLSQTLMEDTLAEIVIATIPFAKEIRWHKENSFIRKSNLYPLLPFPAAASENMGSSIHPLTAQLSQMLLHLLSLACPMRMEYGKEKSTTFSSFMLVKGNIVFRL